MKSNVWIILFYAYMFSGLSRADFDDLLSNLTLRNTSKRSARTVLGLLLMKLRTGLSHRVLATLFGFKKNEVTKNIQRARNIVYDEFVPNNLGLQHITREALINEKTTDLARFLFALGQSEVIHYSIYYQSSYYALQREHIEKVEKVLSTQQLLIIELGNLTGVLLLTPSCACYGISGSFTDDLEIGNLVPKSCALHYLELLIIKF